MKSNLMIWTAAPKDAWMTHIFPVLNKSGWVEDSKDISVEIGLSKRELLGLILIAHSLCKQSGKDWLVGYDPADGDQNDGHVTDGESKWIIEHKVVVQMDTREFLEAIKSTYTKYENKGLDVISGEFELDDIDPEAFEAMVNEWIEKNLDKNAKICKEVWQSEFGKAQRKLNGLVAEMTALKSEHNSSVFNIDF